MKWWVVLCVNAVSAALAGAALAAAISPCPRGIVVTAVAASIANAAGLVQKLPSP